MKVTIIPEKKPDVSIQMTHEEATYLLMVLNRVGGTPRNPVRRTTNALGDALRQARVSYLVEDSARLLSSDIQCSDSTQGIS